MNNREESLKKMPVTCLIILANLVAGILCIMAKNDHFDTGGLNYEYIHNNREYVRLITYMFLHANVAHFFNNMVALLIFGSTVENKLGSLRMAIIYFGSGIGGGAMSVYVSHMINPDTMRFSAGASAAVFGVMCAAVFLRIKGENEARRQDVLNAPPKMVYRSTKFIKNATEDVEKNKEKYAVNAWEKIKTKDNFGEFQSFISDRGLDIEMLEIVYTKDECVKAYCNWAVGREVSL